MKKTAESGIWIAAFCMLLLTQAPCLKAAGTGIDKGTGLFEIVDEEEGINGASVKSLVEYLRKGGEVWFPWIGREEPKRSDLGWKARSLGLLLNYDGPYYLDPDGPAWPQKSSRLKTKIAGNISIRCAGMPNILLVENVSSVSPLSSGLKKWNWPAGKKDFSDIENAPRVHLNPDRYDMVVFSSPGWWKDFANPPSGPSRMSAKVADAVAAFVEKGGTALFIDIAQWDLEKTWPKKLELASLGPYRIDNFKIFGKNKKGKLNLAPFGVVASSVKSSEYSRLFVGSKFKYSDGKKAAVIPAYVLCSPSMGRGFVQGQAFHTFDQDDTLSGSAQRLLLNSLLLAGQRRVKISGSTLPSPVPTKSVVKPSHTPVVEPSPTAVPTRVPTKIPTLVPTDIPTLIPTMVPTLIPTRIPTLVPTRIPTKVPTRIPTRVPALIPYIFPTRIPTPLPRFVATLVPYVYPTSVPVKIRRQPTKVKTRVIRNWPTVTPIKHKTRRPYKKGARRRLLPALAQVIRTSTPLPWTRPTPKMVPLKKKTLARRKYVRKTRMIPSPVVIQTSQETGFAQKAEIRESVHNSLGCMRSAPEPFGLGGAYIYFCLKNKAKIILSVYDQKGQMLWQADPGNFSAGKHQLFFSGYDKEDQLLKPGKYFYRLEADYGRNGAESRQTDFNRKAERSRR